MILLNGFLKVVSYLFVVVGEEILDPTSLLPLYFYKDLFETLQHEFQWFYVPNKNYLQSKC